MVFEKLFVVLRRCRNNCLVFLFARPKVGLTKVQGMARREIGQVSGIPFTDAANLHHKMLKSKRFVNLTSIPGCHPNILCPTLAQTKPTIFQCRAAAWPKSPPSTASNDPCPLLNKILTFENSFCQKRMIHQSISQFSADQAESKEQSIHNIHGITSAKNSVVVKVKDLENYLRIRGYSTLRVGIAILVVTGFGIYMFREPIRENISDEVADVASRSLGLYLLKLLQRFKHMLRGGSISLHAEKTQGAFHALGLKIFGIYLTFYCWRSSVISSIK